MLHRFFVTLLNLLRYEVPTLFEVITPKGKHSHLRWYHRKPLFILWDEPTILPNTQRVGGPVVLDIVQMVNPKAPAKRSRRHNMLIEDLATGQAMLTVTEAAWATEGGTVEVQLPKGLKSRTKGAYGCNHSEEILDWEPCDMAPVTARLFTAIGDAYFVNCKQHVNS